MKSQLKIFKLVFTALALSAGALLLCGFSVRLPSGVFVNGTDVGRLGVAAAKTLLRQNEADYLKSKRLRICAGEYVYEYAYPEIDFRDDFDSVLKSIGRSGRYSSPVHYFLNGAEEIADYICAEHSRPVEEPSARFTAGGEPFVYSEGRDGAECDKERLLDDISASLNGDFGEVMLQVKAVKRSQSLGRIKSCTQKLSAFTTYFSADSAERSHNIRLASQFINGAVIMPDETFSFNGTVGARTEERGFKKANIIEDGKFVQGTGGGVCQVSTTLYNAALLSGLEIVEYHPHSLQVGYVAPSRDAMVSGNYFDLKFKNTRLTPIYVRVNCNYGSVCCTIYGEPDGYTYSVLSEVESVVPRPDAVIVEGDEDGVISYGRDGTVSKGYLIKSAGGEDERILLREDSYPAIADVVQVKRQAVGGAA